MAQTRTHDFSSPRSASLLNRGRKDVNPPGVYVGFDVVVQGAGTFGPAGGAIQVEHTTDSRGILVSREGVRIEENSPAFTSILDIATPHATLDRIDLVVAQHTFGTSNPPATYAVITGTPLATPVEPTIPSDATVLAAVYVENAAGSLTADQIEPRKKVFADTISDFLNGDTRSGKLEGALQTGIIAGTTQLKAIDPADRSRHQITLVENADGIGGTGLYWFDSTSTATDDGLTVIQPTNFFFGTTGRWISLAFSGTGTFIANVGSTVDAQFADLSLALTALEASEARNGIFYLLSNVTLPTNITTTKPVKVIGLEFTSLLTFSAVWTVDVPTVVSTTEAPTLEFSNVHVTRSVPGGEIVFPSAIRFFMEGSILRDLSSSAGNGFVRTTFVTPTNHRLIFERTELRPGTTNSLFESDANAATEFTFRNCLIRSTDLDQFIARNNVSAGLLAFYLYQNTYFESDGFDVATDLGGPVRVIYDDTSLFTGTTEIPARIDNVGGMAVWNDEMERLSSGGTLDVGDVMKFYLGPELKIAEGSYAFSGATVLSFVSQPPRIIRGSGRDATTLTSTMPPSSGLNLISSSGTCMEFSDLSFEITFNALNSTGDVLIQSGGIVPFNLRRVRVKVLGGVIDRAISLIVGQLEDIIMEGDATGTWDRALTVSPSTGETARCEKIKISEFTGVGAVIGGPASADQIDVNVAKASALFLGISVADTARISHCRVHGVGGSTVITGGTGIKVNGSGVQTPGALADGNVVEGTNPTLTKVIDTGIKIDGGRSIISNNIITECGADGILIDTGADENLVTGNSITDCALGAAIDDVATATTNAKTGNYSKGNLSGIDTPNKAGNIEL